MPGPGRLRAVLTARFDDAALQACDWQQAAAAREALDATESAEFERLLRACIASVDAPAAAPWIEFETHGLNHAKASRVATALCLELDGSRRMLACGSGVSRLRLRLAVKLHEALPWRTRRADDPWDSGWARCDAAGLAALANFLPRRPTLIVVDGADSADGAACVHLLRQRGVHGAHPLRLLMMKRR